ncbi:calcium-transporting ATPase 1 [Clostridium saccharobutylicum]|uniref:P-type ATPase n=1 Tax=Clostridium saccharobutylicum TaxID=169679 RepID=UPI000983F4DA|nr:cation-transporting P-type ATPase [Clostridium saccharobutylicum]AQS08993.1 calcium-transporting ATPase 1 [Clostridium saccharobutylicum]MBC2435499.1 cation-transporting P-type ATPase [Clostridium saccharobutylicum]NSB87226.1 magnesium-transporting ATPase (P-type) [Clostridium saccharobutylicum]NYC28653.1 magnesium-transporting ATPase (P-type) [Clostridium saccharobutylicum]OOM18335.1 calcium-transporting ATPase 1 [Clostridium saccharobutylicum]
MEKYCINSWTKIVEWFNSDIQLGISDKDCAAIRQKYGGNKMDLPSANKLYVHMFNALKQKVLMLQLIILIILLLLKYYLFSSVVGGFLILNLSIAILHTIKRNKEIVRLQKLASTEAIVIRDGIEKVIKSDELVVGDMVKFFTDSIIPADLRIINANDVKVDENFITGDEQHKKKNEQKIIGSIDSLKEMQNILFKGSKIECGNGLGIVIATGKSTQLGRILAMLIYSSSRKHNFAEMIFKKMEKDLLIYLLAIISVGSYFIYFGQDIQKKCVATALFALGCLPFGIIAFLSFKGVIKKFANENVDILNFSVFNLIKDVNILFLDKVGAISKKEMVVKKLFINDDLISTDDPYLKETTFDRIVEISLICNNASYDMGVKSEVGGLDEIAFLRYGTRKKFSKYRIDNAYSRIIEIPMDSDKRFLTIVTRLSNRYRANTRGNVDAVLEQCTYIMIEGVERELTEEYKTKIKTMDMNFSIEGLITQGFAYRNFTYEPSSDENIESNMVFVGIVGLENPLEDDLHISLNKIKDKGLVPIIFTEESKLSAITNAKKANLIKNSNQVVAGIELDSLNQQELKELLCRVRVFCRVTSEIKSKIISLFIKDGHQVVTTGELFGDLPALNLSNVGIAKGNVSPLVKKISDVYIKENYLDGFFKIRDFSRALNKNIDRTFSTFYIMILSELFILIGSIIIGQTEGLDFWNVLILNGILLVPLSLINILNEGRNISKNEIVIKSLILSIITMISIYKVNGKEATIIPLTIISIGMLILTLSNNNVSLRKFSNELKLAIISFILILISVGCIIIVNGIVLRDIIIIELVVSIIFLIIFEILSRKWKNSLMR